MPRLSGLTLCCSSVGLESRPPFQTKCWDPGPLLRQRLNCFPNFQCQTLQRLVVLQCQCQIHLTWCRALGPILWEECCRVECPPTPTVETQQQIDNLVREREFSESHSRQEKGQWCAKPFSLRQGGPTNSPAELEGWISERNCNLKNVLEFGNAGTHRLELCRVKASPRCCDGRAVEVIVDAK